MSATNNREKKGLTEEQVAGIARLMGLGVEFSRENLIALLPAIEAQFRSARSLRSLMVNKDVEPDVTFKAKQ